MCVVGPTYPFRGGIAHHTTLLARELEKRNDVLLVSFARQYPSWALPSGTDLDPSSQPLRSSAEFLLSPFDPPSWARTARRIREWRPDWVVLPWWIPVWAPAYAYLGRALTRGRGADGPRLVCVCHNTRPHDRTRLGTFADRTALRFALRAVDGFVVHATSEAERLRRAFPARAIRRVPMPDFGELAVTAPAPLPVSLPTDRPILLFCGFVRPYKGLDVLVDALPSVLARERVHLVVVGEFWQSEARYRERIARRGVTDAVTVVPGYVPDEVLVSFIRAANVVVLPYRRATQSAVVQLAFGVGRPAIVTTVGGLPDAVEHGVNGLLVPPEDPAALADAIVSFVRDGLGARFEANIRSRSTPLAWERLVGCLEELGAAPLRSPSGAS
ncbi:MAG: glycosyltransferase [Deltaproteobacteria bacterium]|nr:glycosyltransferase [Deltaproteobacteria bacterium]